MTKNEAVARLIEYAEAQLGYRADANQRNKYAEMLDAVQGFYNGRKNGYDWCDVFVDSCFVACFGASRGRLMVRQPEWSLGAGCKYSARYYKQANALYNSPERGDQIFFGPEGDDHTGIVYEVKQGKVTTIEGNAGAYPGEVKKNTYNLNDSWIYAYGRPKWDEVADVILAQPDFEPHPLELWGKLSEWLHNDYGVAGLMGNLEAESGLVAGNLQNSYEKSLGMTDEEYTRAVDAGKYTNFSSDHAGYGLAQWTYSTRKAALKELCDGTGASIGNQGAQVLYLMKEIEGSFPDVYRALKTATNIAEASDPVLLDFERPADQSEANLERRRARGQKFYDLYHDPEPVPPTPQPGGQCEVKARIIGIGDEGNDVKSLQGILEANGFDLEYCGGCDGIFGSGTEYALKAYQREHGLKVDGEAGEETWSSMLKA